MGVCRGKAALSSGCKSHPATAPVLQQSREIRAQCAVIPRHCQHISPEWDPEEAMAKVVPEVRIPAPLVDPAQRLR
jgi:hypothetical protein